MPLDCVMVAPPSVYSDVALAIEAVDDGVKPRPCLGSVDGLGTLGVVCDGCHLALLSTPRDDCRHPCLSTKDFTHTLLGMKRDFNCQLHLLLTTKTSLHA